MNQVLMVRDCATRSVPSLHGRWGRRLGRAMVLCGFVVAACVLTGCGNLSRLSEVGRNPAMTPSGNPTKDPGWRPITLPMPARETSPKEANALWRSGSRAFFKDQRAATVGDIVTVVVNINDTANLQNNTTADRKGFETAGMPNLMGLEAVLPAVISPKSLVSTNSENNNVSTGQVTRNEIVTLRLAGVVTQVLPNGNLAVAASQEFMVNGELRQLHVTGVIRPQDIASDNTVQHDRMAEARISYGGRGTLTDLQRPRWGEQMFDILMPF